MATKANLVIDQGATFSADLDITDENGDIIQLSGYTASSQIRKWYTSTKFVEFTTSVNSDIGVITLSLTANQTALLTAGRYVYDVEITDNVTISRIVEGIITVNPNVTR